MFTVFGTVNFCMKKGMIIRKLFEKMFQNLDESNENYNTFFVGKKRNNKKKVVAPQDTDPKNYYHDIQELLKNYSLDNDNNEDEKGNKNNKKRMKIKRKVKEEKRKK